LADDLDADDIQDFSFSKKLLSEEYEELLIQRMEQKKSMNQNDVVNLSEMIDI